MDIIEAAVAELGVEQATPLIQGGQKLVLKAVLAGQDVVVKVVPLPEGVGAEHALERAQREVDLLAVVDSPHVVKVLSDAVEIGDRPEAVCWVEEFLDGDDLRDLLGSPWTDAATFRLLVDVATGLKACHDLEVVHRDLSPGNVRRCQDGHFVLMDPGFARHLTRTALTGLWQPGTPGYRSPEHVPGGDPAPASDVFSLGILGFQARTTYLPVDPAGSDEEYFRRLTEQDVVAVRDVDESVDLELAQVLDRCLYRQPARRFLDGAEMLEAMGKRA